MKRMVRFSDLYFGLGVSKLTNNKKKDSHLFFKLCIVVNPAPFPPKKLSRNLLSAKVLTVKNSVELKCNKYGYEKKLGHSKWIVKEEE